MNMTGQVEGCYRSAYLFKFDIMLYAIKDVDMLMYYLDFEYCNHVVSVYT